MAQDRWSYWTEGNPFEDDPTVAAWAKQYYDDPNVNPNDAIQEQLKAYRTKYGASAGQGDRDTLHMIASGQSPSGNPWSSFGDTSRFDDLWGKLSSIFNQSTNVDGSDPNVQRQTDAYAARTERERRGAVTDAAERYGPLANLQGIESRLRESAGNAVGSFEANTIANENIRRRNEALQAAGLGGQFLGQQRGLDQSWLQSLMGNDLAMRQLGLQDWDRQMYWDLLQRGILS